MSLDLGVVERLLERLYLGGGALRDEDRKKAREVADLLDVVARTVSQPVPRGRPRTLVDAAAGHGYVGLCAAALLGWRRVVAIERDADRLARVRAAAARLDVPIELELRAGTLGIDGVIPEAPDVLVALHACGPATDAVIDGGVAARARWILCAPCCYGDGIAGWQDADRIARELGLPADASVRGRFQAAFVDGARLDRLRAAGYEAGLVAFTAPTVTPHDLVFRARRGGHASRA